MPTLLALALFASLAASSGEDRGADKSPAPQDPSSSEASANSFSAATAASEPKPTEQAKITDRNHPDFVRCRSEKVIGSNAKRRRVCMKNSEWAQATSAGNQGARDIVESQQVGMNGNQ